MCVFGSLQIVSRVAESCVLCVKHLQESTSVSSYENNNIRESRPFTHNHNHLMGTIAFKVHHITLTFPRNTFVIIYKSILNLFAFSCFLHIFLLSTMKYIMHRHIREKRNTLLFLIKHLFLTMQVLHLTEHDFYELYTNVYD